MPHKNFKTLLPIQLIILSLLFSIINCQTKNNLSQKSINLIPNCEKFAHLKNKTVCKKCIKGYAILDKDNTKCFSINSELQEKILSKSIFQDPKKPNHFHTCSKKIKNCLFCENANKCIECKENYTLFTKNNSTFYCTNLRKLDEEEKTNETSNNNTQKEEETDDEEEDIIDFFFDDDAYTECTENCLECANMFQCKVCEIGYAPIDNKTKCEKVFCQYKMINYTLNMERPSLHEVDILVKNYAYKYVYRNDYVIFYKNIDDSYSITIFKDSTCTYYLLTNGYFQIDTTTIIDKIKQRTNEKEIIQVYFKNKRHEIILYYDKNGDRIDLEKVCPKCLNQEYNIIKSYEKFISERMGIGYLNSVKEQKIDVFNVSIPEINDICTNVYVNGFDVPLKDRKKKLYQGYCKEKSDILCGEFCTENKRNYKESISYCNCTNNMNLNSAFSIDFSISKENCDYKEHSIADEVKDSINLFNCIPKTFKNGKYKNIFFFISLLIVIFQIILFMRFWGKKNFSTLDEIIVSSPPPKSDGRNEKKKIDNDFKPTDQEQIISFRGSETTETYKGFNINENNIAYTEDTENLIRDYLPLERARVRDPRTFMEFFIYILMLKLPISNVLLFFCDYQPFITLELRLLKFSFMTMVLFFFNAVSINQIYLSDKYEYFNRKYDFENKPKPITAIVISKFFYSLIHCIPFQILPITLYLIILSIVNCGINMRSKIRSIILQCNYLPDERTKITKIKEQLKNVQEGMRTIIKVFFVVNIIFMITMMTYLATYGNVYKYSSIDLFGFVTTSYIFLHLIGLVIAFILTAMRFLGIKKINLCSYNCSYRLLEIFNA